MKREIRCNINIEEKIIRFDVHKYKSNEEENILRKSKLDNKDLFKVIGVLRNAKNKLKSKSAKEKNIYISLMNL